MCRVLRVSASGYYDWRSRPLSERKKEDKVILKKIWQIHIDSKRNYGTIKIWKELKNSGDSVGKNRIARLRRQNGIETKRRKRFKVTTMSKNTKWVAPNLLNRRFRSERPNRVWVGDVTYIATRAGWLYLAVLLDLYSRKVIGWSMSERNNRQLVLNALNMALERRMPSSTVLHHTDRGSIYGSDEYRNRLKEAGLVASMSRKADCYDNAVAESFFSTLKNELINDMEFQDRTSVRSEIFKFIEVFYNRKRIHQSLGYVSPELC